MQTYIESKKHLYIDVQAQDVKDAIRCNKNNCVLAKSCNRQIRGFVAIQVGTAITSLVLQDKKGFHIIRHLTAGPGRKALRIFDETGKWTIPLGRTLLGRPMNENNSLLANRIRVKAARKQGKCVESGARSEFPARKTARRMSAR